MTRELWEYHEENDPLFRINNDVVFANTTGSKVVEFYTKKSIFITGGTGFLGKLLIEKLLRACNGLDKIYLLVRSKKGVSSEARLQHLFDDIVFSQLAKVNPNFWKKIQLINGDILQPNLGINSTDIQLLINKVNIIFHLAATVRFNEELKEAININVRGTQKVLELGKNCKNLISFVYVSTVFSNCNLTNIDEHFVEPEIDAEEILRIVDGISDKDSLDSLTKRLLNGRPNTYSYTKALAEEFVNKYHDDLPLCIYRPSIVLSTFQEPIKSWIDNMYGAAGIVIGAGLGVLRSFHCNHNLRADIVPADYVINGLIAVAYKTGLGKTINREEVKFKKISIYNYVASVNNAITWGKFNELHKRNFASTPLSKTIWSYNLKFYRHFYVHIFNTILRQFLPAYALDFGRILFGKSPRMVHVSQKVYKSSSALSYFTTHEWQFRKDNTENLWNELSDVDKKVFPFNMEDFDWDEYMGTLDKGLRVYLLKDQLSTVPKAMEYLQRVYYIRKCFKFLIATLQFLFMYRILNKCVQYF